MITKAERDQESIVVQPIKSIGNFYAKLPEHEQKFARKLAKRADRTPKHELDREYFRLRNVAETWKDHSNFVPVDQL